MFQKPFITFFLISILLFYNNMAPSNNAESDSTKYQRKLEQINNQIEFIRENIKSNHDSLKPIINRNLKLSLEYNYQYGIVWNHFLMGRFHQLRFENDSALVYYHKSWDIARHENEIKLAYAISLGIANIYWESGNYSDGLLFCMDAKELFESKNLINNKVGLLNLLALNYEGILEFDQAQKYYDQALEMAQKNHDTGFVAIINSNQGRMYYKKGNYQSALVSLLKGSEMEIENDLLSNAAKSYTLIGKVYVKLNHPDSAYYYLQKAHKINTRQNDQLGLVRTYNAYGIYYHHIKNYKLAIDYLQKSIDLAEKIKLNEELVEAYELIAKSYYETNNFQKSADYYRKYQKQYQNLYDIKEFNKLVALEHKLKIESHQNQINQLKLQEQENQNKYLKYLSVFIITLLIVLILFVLYYRKVNKTLKQKNTEINEQKIVYEELNEKLILAEQSIGKADEIKNQFINNLSHEIRTPLNGIVGFSALIADSNYTEEKRPDIWNMIQKSSEDLINTVEGVLDLSLLASKQVSFTKKEVQFNIFLNTLQFEINKLKLLYANKKINIKYFMSPLLTHQVFFTDPVLLKKSILNITDNALKFMDSGTINIHIVLDENDLQISVSDEGIGIVEDEQLSVFNQFQKGSNVDDATRGLGIGLTLTQKYVDILNGKVWHERKEKKGTIFYIRVPVTKS